MPSGAVEANTTPPAASTTAARPAATSAQRLPAAGCRTKFGWMASSAPITAMRSEEHTSELQSLRHLVCRLLLEKKKKHDDKPVSAHSARPFPDTARSQACD